MKDRKKRLTIFRAHLTGIYYMADATMFMREFAIIASEDLADGSWRMIAVPSSKFAITDLKLEAGDMVPDLDSATVTQKVTMTFKLIEESKKP